jgi:hypothetical protein
VNKSPGIQLTKQDQPLWLTADYVFRGPFVTSGSTIPTLEVMNSIVTKTAELIAAKTSLVAEILAKVTDAKNNSFLVYPNLFANTDYNLVKNVSIKIKLETSKVDTSIGTDVLPLSKALLQISAKPDRYAQLVQDLTAKGESIFYDTLMLYILGYTNIGMHNIYLDMKKAEYFIIAPQLTAKTGISVTKQIEKKDFLFYLSGLFPKKARDVFYDIVVDYVSAVARRLKHLTFNNKDASERKSRAHVQLTDFEVEIAKIYPKLGWPGYPGNFDIIDLENQEIIQPEPEPEPESQVVLYELADKGERGFFLVEKHRQEESKVKAQSARLYNEGKTSPVAERGGMHSVGRTYYTYSWNEDASRFFTSKNLLYALRVYIRKNNFEQAARITTELWRLNELFVPEYKKLFHSIAASAIKEIGPANPSLVLNTISQIIVWCGAKSALEVVFAQVLNLVKLLCESDKSRRHIYIEWSSFEYPPEEEEQEALDSFETRGDTTSELINAACTLPDQDKLISFKLALYSLINKNEHVFYWLDVFFKPEGLGAASRLKFSENQTKPISVLFDIITRGSSPNAIPTFLKYYKLNSNYYVLVYLCYMAIHRYSLGQYEEYADLLNKDISQLEEELLSGKYTLEIDEWAYPPGTTDADSLLLQWQDSLEFPEVKIAEERGQEDSAKDEYVSSEIAWNRDVMG